MSVHSVTASNQPLQGFQLYVLLIAIALVAFLISLDGFIINVALTTISGELGVREDVATWLITTFSMTSTLFVPISGYLSLRIGNIRLFLIGLVGFSIASFFCATAHFFTELLIFRAFQGASAGLLIPVSLALIITNFPEEKKNVAIGFWSFFVMVGPAMGPMIGGWLSDGYWHWIFLLNIPFCIFSGAIVLIFLGGRKEKGENITLDWVGLSLLFILVAAPQSAMNRWNIYDWFCSPTIVALFIAAFIALAFFIVWEIYHPTPFIDVGRLKSRNFLFPSLTTGIGMAMLFSSFVLDSLWVQRVLGYTPAWAGLTLSPVGIFPLIMYPLMGRIVSYLDLRIWVLLSFILYALTFFWLSEINLYTPFWLLALPRLAQGIGFAMFTVPNAILVTQGIKPEKLTSSVSLFSFIRMLFVGYGVALAVTLWIFRQTFYQTRITSHTLPQNPALQGMIQSFNTVVDSEPVSIGLSYEMVRNQAWTLALADIYYLYAWLFLALCLLVPFYKPFKNKN